MPQNKIAYFKKYGWPVKLSYELFQTKSKSINDVGIIIPEYETSNSKLLVMVEMSCLPIDIVVVSIPSIIKGSSTGKDRIGKIAPRLFALEIIADIIVEADAIPMLAKSIVNPKTETFSTGKLKNIRNRIVAKRLIEIARIILKSNLPKYIA